MFPEGMDFGALLSQAQAMQAQLAQAQEELAEATETGTAGGGLVSATVSGAGDLVALEIKPEAVDVDDLEGLSDLIIAAFRDATGKLTTRAQEMMPDMGALGQFGMRG